MLKSSIYASFFLVVSAYSLFFSSLRIKIKNRLDLFVEAWLVLLRITLAIVASFWLKNLIGQLLEVEDDSHIFDILYSKFFNYQNFHTMLYTCSSVFDFLPFKVFRDLTVTGLVPFATIGVSNVLYYWLYNAIVKYRQSNANKDEIAIDSNKMIANKEQSVNDDSSTDDSGIENNGKGCDEKTQNTQANNVTDDDDSASNELISSDKTSKKECYDGWVKFLRGVDIDPAVFYNISQMCVFGIMAIIIMRLKLLFTPHLCLMSSFVMTPKYYSR